MPTEQKNAPPEIAVLIVSYNSAEDLPRCIASIQKHFALIHHEVCVIDNASGDESAVLTAQKFPSVKLIRNPKNLGFAAAINQGIQNTKAPILFWMNPDSEITAGDISNLLNYFKTNPKTGILGVKIINPDGSLQLSARTFPSYSTALFNRYSLLSRLFPKNPITRNYLGTHWDHREIRKVDWVSGAALMHRRNLVDEIGPLDETFFMYCEDVDFCFRATRAGSAIVYHPGLTLNHAIGGSSKTARTRMILERHRSIWHYYKKHFKRNPFKDFLVACGILARYVFLRFTDFLQRPSS